MVRSGAHHAEIYPWRSRPGAADPILVSGDPAALAPDPKEIDLTSGRSALRGSRYRRGRYHL
jgi:hypothetical protein